MANSDFPDNVSFGGGKQKAYRSRLDDWLLLVRDSKPENTLKAYKQDWRHFYQWCKSGSFENTKIKSRHALPALPETIIDYIKFWIGLEAPATIRRRLSTISKLHTVAGANNPINHVLVKETIKMIGRGYKKQTSGFFDSKTFYEKKLEQLESIGLHEDELHSNLSGDQRQAKGLTWSHLIKVKELLEVKPLIKTEGLPLKKAQAARRQNGIWTKNARDRAIIHCAFDSMLRVSELVKLKIEDVDIREDNSALLKIGKRKDSQEGEVAKAYLAPDTVNEIHRWLELAGFESGPLFCSLTKSGGIRRYQNTLEQKPLRETNVSDIYKSVTHKIGEDPSLFSCHSTRVGAAQDMLEENIGMLAVKQAGRWKSDRMPSRYAKDIEASRGGMAQLSMKKNRS